MPDLLCSGFGLTLSAQLVSEVKSKPSNAYIAVKGLRNFNSSNQLYAWHQSIN